MTLTCSFRSFKNNLVPTRLAWFDDVFFITCVNPVFEIRTERENFISYANWKIFRRGYHFYTSIARCLILQNLTSRVSANLLIYALWTRLKCPTRRRKLAQFLIRIIIMDLVSSSWQIGNQTYANCARGLLLIVSKRIGMFEQDISMKWT